MINNIVTKKIMTSKEAIEYLGCSEYSFEQEVKRGNISFKAVGRIRLFPVWALDKWLNDTQIHIDCSNVVESTMHTSPLSAKQEKEYSLERRLDAYRKQKLLNTASNVLKKYKRKAERSPVVNCLV